MWQIGGCQQGFTPGLRFGIDGNNKGAAIALQALCDSAKFAGHNRNSGAKCRVQRIAVSLRIGAWKPDHVGTFKRQQLGQVLVGVFTPDLDLQVLCSRNGYFGETQHAKCKAQLFVTRSFRTSQQAIKPLQASEFAEQQNLLHGGRRPNPFFARRMCPDNRLHIRKMFLNSIGDKAGWCSDTGCPSKQLPHFTAPVIN